jgi:hypothetical protein
VPSTTTDPLRIERTVLALAGPEALASIIEPLTDADYAKIDEILAKHAPVHLAVMDALNPDGSIRDQAAFDRMLNLAGQEQGR